MRHPGCSSATASRPPPYRVLMVWVYDHTRSPLLPVVMHVPIVVAQYVLTPEGIAGSAMFASLLAYAAVLWVAVGAVMIAGRGPGD